MRNKVFLPATTAVEAVVFVTDRCRGRCKYCFVDRNRGREIKKKQFEAFLELLRYVAPLGAQITLYFQGAEALLASEKTWRELAEVFERYRKKLRLSANLQTGVFVTEEELRRVTREWFPYFDTVSTSFDFARDINVDQLKKKLDKIEEVIGRECRGCVIVMSRDVYGREKEVISIAESIIRKKRFRLRELVKHPKLSSDVFLTLEELTASYKRFVDLYFEDYFSFERLEPISSILRALQTNSSIEGNCSYMQGCANMFSLTPWGIYPCDLFGEVAAPNKWIDIENPSKLREGIETIEKFRKRKPKECEGCDYWRFCHGGCPARAYTYFGDCFRKDYVCEVIKRLVDYVDQKRR